MALLHTCRFHSIAARMTLTNKPLSSYTPLKKCQLHSMAYLIILSFIASYIHLYEMIGRTVVLSSLYRLEKGPDSKEAQGAMLEVTLMKNFNISISTKKSKSCFLSLEIYVTPLCIGSLYIAFLNT